MRSRSGFSLVEMVVVLVLAGIVSTAAISMFSTQNRLNASMTALGESQENARSAVEVAATEIRGASDSSIVRALPDRVVLRVPVIMGIVCAQTPGPNFHVYLPMDDMTLDLHREIDGYAGRVPPGEWTYRDLSPADGFFGGASRQPCRDEGHGEIGEDSDYLTLGGLRQPGTPILLFREVEYGFGPSALDETQRAFSRTRDGLKVELAQGFATTSHFEYRLAGDDVWRPSIDTGLDAIDAIRVVVEVWGRGTSGLHSGSASFTLTREILLRNAR